MRGYPISMTFVTLISFSSFNSVVSADLLTNGGFETPDVAGDFQNFASPNTDIAGWNVTAGSVDIVNTFFPAFAGDQSLDLVGDSLGTVEQSFATSPGRRYFLSFAYANNPVTNPFVYSADVEVLGTGTLLYTYIDHSGSTRADMSYDVFSQAFTADSSTSTLRFTATNNLGNAGIVIDAVSVAVPEPSSFLYGGLNATLAGVGYRMKRRSS